MKNPRMMQRFLAAGYAGLGIAAYIHGQPTVGAAFFVIGVAWFALSLSRFAAKSPFSK
ncbi:MAG: hypothetical protein WA823_17395 [Candidatus Acidiferrales bacterium]